MVHLAREGGGPHAFAKLPVMIFSISHTAPGLHK